jgi:chemotaxis regulatin CheY-phosphate phosphatase CheZ
VFRPAELSDEEYELLEENIARTAKGRAFLRRHARRAAGAAAEEVRAMMGQIRAMMLERTEAMEAAGHIDILRRELMEMASSIERARREIAALRPADEEGAGDDRILTATNELDAIVSSTERASQEILNSAERIMELAGKLRRAGADADACADIENETTNIFTACSFQDLTGQRTSKVVNALRYIEQRVNAMIGIWGVDGLERVEDDGPRDHRPDAHLLAGPQLEGQGVSQDDIDRMLAGDLVAPAPAPAPAPAAEAKPAKRKAPAKAPDPPPKAKAPEPPKDEGGPALDQSAIDALFG